MASSRYRWRVDLRTGEITRSGVGKDTDLLRYYSNLDDAERVAFNIKNGNSLFAINPHSGRIEFFETAEKMPRRKDGWINFSSYEQAQSYEDTQAKEWHWFNFGTGDYVRGRADLFVGEPGWQRFHKLSDVRREQRRREEQTFWGFDDDNPAGGIKSFKTTPPDGWTYSRDRTTIEDIRLGRLGEDGERALEYWVNRTTGEARAHFVGDTLFGGESADNPFPMRGEGWRRFDDWEMAKEFAATLATDGGGGEGGPTTREGDLGFGFNDSGLTYYVYIPDESNPLGYRLVTVADGQPWPADPEAVRAAGQLFLSKERALQYIQGLTGDGGVDVTGRDGLNLDPEGLIYQQAMADVYVNDRTTQANLNQQLQQMALDDELARRESFTQTQRGFTDRLLSDPQSFYLLTLMNEYGGDLPRAYAQIANSLGYEQPFGVADGYGGLFGGEGAGAGRNDLFRLMMSGMESQRMADDRLASQMHEYSMNQWRARFQALISAGLSAEDAFAQVGPRPTSPVTPVDAGLDIQSRMQQIAEIFGALGMGSEMSTGEGEGTPTPTPSPMSALGMGDPRTALFPNTDLIKQSQEAIRRPMSQAYNLFTSPTRPLSDVEISDAGRRGYNPRRLFTERQRATPPGAGGGGLVSYRRAPRRRYA